MRQFLNRLAIAFVLLFTANTCLLALTIAEFPIPSPDSNAEGITSGPDGAVWFAENASSGKRIARVSTAGVFTEYPLPAGVSGVDNLVAGPDGALWFNEQQGKIGRMTPAGSFSDYAIPSGSGPAAITAGPDGALWFTELTGKIGRISTSGSTSEFSITAGSLPYGITTGPDGAIWFTEFSGDRVGRITTAGTVTEYALPPLSLPQGIVTGPDGALWFTENNKIGRITTGGVLTHFAAPSVGRSIVAGSDGALWFVEASGNRIARITPSGVVTEFATPTADTNPWAITLGPDGALWFTEGTANKIGRMALPQTIHLVQSSAAEGSSVSSLPVSFPSANAAGNLILVFVRMSGTSQSLNITDTKGNSYTEAVSQTQDADGHQIHLFYAVNISAGSNTVTATFSGINNHPWIAIYEYSGLRTVNPLDQVARAQGSDASPTTNIVTTSGPDELVFAAIGLPATAFSGTVAAGNGYALAQQDTNTSRAATEMLTASAKGQYASNFSLSSAANWSAVAATLKADSAAADPVSIATTSLPTATQNQFYSAALTVTGGRSPYQWSTVSGNLPAGLQLGADTGTISGTPSNPGGGSLTLQVIDGNSQTAIKTLNLAVASSGGALTRVEQDSASITYSGGWFTISDSSYSGGTAVTTIDPTATATISFNGTGIAWIGERDQFSGIAQLLVDGVSVGTVDTYSAAGGNNVVIYSAAGLSPGSHSLTIRVLRHEDGASNGYWVSLDAFDITPNPAAVTITTASLPAGTQNVSYTAMLMAGGGSSPYSWSLDSGSLPPGLALNASNGAISGTPTAAGTSSFVIRVTDANSQSATRSFNLTINPGSGGGGGSIALVQSASQEGSGVASVSASFSKNVTASNLIVVFVRMSGTSQTVNVSDNQGNVYTDAVAQTQDADGHQVHILYAKNVSGGPVTVTSTFSAVNNHPWLAIYEYSGLSTSNPLDQTTHAQGSDNNPSLGAITTASANELVFGAVGLPATSFAGGIVTAGSGYTLELQDSGSSRAANEEAITGPPGPYTATFTLSSPTNWSAVAATFRADSGAASAPTITTQSLISSTCQGQNCPNLAEQGAAYSASVIASGGSAPYRWSVASGNLPAGVSLNATTGNIAGTPTQVGAYTFTIQVTDSASQSTSKQYTLSVNPPLASLNHPLPNGTVNVPYSEYLNGASAGVPNYGWAVISGSFPPGIGFGAASAETVNIAGTPTQAGTFNFTVQTTDAYGAKVTAAFSITIGTGSGSAINLKQSASLEGSGVSSLKLSFPSTNAPGDLIIVFLRMSTTTQTVNVADSMSNLYTDAVSQTQDSDGHQVHIFYAKNIAGGANTVTATFSGVNNHPWMAIYEYTGLSTTNPLDQTAHSQGSDSSPFTGTITTTAANELEFSATGLPATAFSGTVAAGAGYALEQQDVATSRAANEDAVTAGAGQYGGRFNLSSPANWSAVAATFRQ